MRTLFEFDFKNYKEGGTVGHRDSVRAVIIRDGKIAMTHSLAFDYYKLPGGGIEIGETHKQTLIREVLEETGLMVKPETIREFGQVIRKEKGLHDDLFIQNNYYYFCQVQEEIKSQRLDELEEVEDFVLEWVTPEQVIDVNENHKHPTKEDTIAQHMIERETRVMKMLLDEGIV
mgnify:CR=1 FL=1